MKGLHFAGRCRAANRKLRQVLVDVAVGCPTSYRRPLVAVAPCCMRKGATNDDRRMGFLNRLSPGHHRRKINELAVIFGR
jgi:hypothetical protein